VCHAQAQDDEFAGDVRDALEQSRLAPDRLELDVSESVVLGNPERATAALAGIKALGVVIGFTGFGMGRAALADLKRFPITVLKVSGERLRGVALDIEKQAYAEGIVALGKALGFTVVASGIVSAMDADWLSVLGCAAVQGPFCGPAVEAGVCAALLAERLPVQDAS
jgi:EAL domain-containing protein (putative c-di-GMP-specific phosphodiesterase class I)